MSTPRAVLVERPTEYELLLARHATREQVRFFLATRDRSLEEVEAAHAGFAKARAAVLGAVPPDWRTATIGRDDLDRFLWADGDVVVALGQDGLVANVARYLDGQPVLGLNPDPERIDGVLVRHPVAAAGDLLRDVAAGRARTQERTMAAARRDDGAGLLALNEVFFGHASHQSARYTLEEPGGRERQSSSGVIVATATGATGWAASVARERGAAGLLPAPDEGALAWFVREAWPSRSTGTSHTAGRLAGGDRLRLVCELGEGGTIFGDGIEQDALPVDWGQVVEIAAADRVLRLVA